eukprot:1737710-Pyramimonas_sp.AAC.1
MTSAGTASPKRASATLASNHAYSSASSTSPPPKRAARRWACRFASRNVCPSTGSKARTSGANWAGKADDRSST